MKRWIIFLLLILSSVESSAQLQDSLIKSEPNSLQFFVFGDWGRKGESSKRKDVKQSINQESLAVAMDQVGAVIKPDFILSTGDNFYPDGVKSDADPRWKETFEDIYQGRNLQCRWYVVLGNHDHKGNVQGEINYTKKDPKQRWFLPSNYYSQIMSSPDGAKVKFIFIDTTPLVKRADSLQLDWLKKELSEGAYDWKFVVGHHPLYSGNYRKHKRAILRRAIEKLMIENHVNVYVSGHDHNLQYLKKGNINYFVSGAGSEVYKSKQIKGVTQFIYCGQGSECTSAFMVFSLTQARLTIQMVDSRGQLVYKNNIGR